MKNISAKNRVWALMVLLLLACCVLSFYLIYIDGIKDKFLMISYSSLLLITFLSIILTRILISKFVKSISEDFFYISENCSNGDNSLKNIKDNLSGFISTTGSELDKLTESSKLMQDIISMLIETTKNSEVCKELSDKVTRDVNEGNEIMQKMVDSILTIEKTKDGLVEISSLIKQISNDTSTIHTIVSTTELLSLNASIEAAKAGQTGKGFSVVAEEVGNLAKHSGSEANEIENIVIESQKQIQIIIEANQSRVEVGKVSSNNALAVFSAIKAEMFGISSHSENIRVATWEQKLSIDQISSANFEMRNILKKNISDTVNLLKIYDINLKNFENIKEVAYVLNEYWSGERKNG
ncbi:MAG: hypothetical protein K2X69_05320 [Silvanigrellaceae bacterium]|nr:hypothetical protein [Silvanigrellaceae bacterium]